MLGEAEEADVYGLLLEVVLVDVWMALGAARFMNFFVSYFARMYFSISESRSDSSRFVGGGCIDSFGFHLAFALRFPMLFTDCRNHHTLGFR